MQTDKTKLNALTCLHVTSAIQYLTKIPKTYPEGKAASLTNGAGEKMDVCMLKNVFKPISTILHKN